MTEIIKALVHKDDYPNPEVGDRYADEELGTLTLVEVTPVGESFILVYESRRLGNSFASAAGPGGR